MKYKIDPRAKALIFDIDGTLADTMEAHLQAIQNVMAPFGVRITAEILAGTAGIPVFETMELYRNRYNLTNFDPARAAIQKEEAYRKTICHAKPLQPVFDIFETWYGRMPIACGTGGDRITATLTLEAIGLKDKIDVVVTCDDVKNGKPAPDTFLKCAELLGVDPQYCVVFEDAELGIQAAKSAGMMVCDVRTLI